MAARLLTDDVWERVRIHLPERSPRQGGGRPRIGDREVLTGVLFVLKTGIAWEDLPDEMGCGCGMTCLRRLRHWQESGTWARMQQVLEMHLKDAARHDWSRVHDGLASSARSPWARTAAERGLRASRPTGSG